MSDLKLNIEISSKVNDATSGINKVTKEVEKLKGSTKGANVFESISDGAKGLAEDVSSSLGPVGGLIARTLTTPIGAAAAALLVLGTQIKLVFDESLKGEKLNALDSQFQNLAKSVNISADNLKNRLVKSMDGLIDGADSIRIANRALITLGEKAEQLPKLMDAARKATKAFGGDSVENLELLVRAIESGNTKILRQIGLNIDAEKSLEKYANSLGSTSKNLSEQGRQQGIINAILDESNKKFKNVDSTLTPLADSLKRLGNTIGDLREDFSKLISNNFSKSFTDIFESINNGLKKISGNFTASDKVKELAGEIEKVQSKINQLNAEKDAFKGIKGISAAAAVSTLNIELDKQKSKLSSLNLEYTKTKTEVDKANVALDKDTESTKKNVNSKSLLNQELVKNLEYYGDFARFLGSQDPNAIFDVDLTAINQTYEQFSQVKKQVDELAEKAKQKTAEIEQAFASGLTNGLLDFASGIKSAEDAFNDFARGFLRKITEMILQQFILNAISGSSIGKSLGGAAAGGGGGTGAVTAATGGFITGPGTATSDSIPARLSNGEFVMKAAAVKNLGVDFLHGLNNIGRGGVHAKTKGGVRAFADGGLVPGAMSGPPQVVIQNNGTPKDQMSTSFDPASQVTTIILQDYQKNGPISKAMQGTFGAKRGGFR